MSAVNALGTVAEILGKLPPAMVKDFVGLLGDLLAGRSAKAAERARLIAETLAIKEAARSPYRAKRL
jgi:hypothetical protein